MAGIGDPRGPQARQPIDDARARKHGYSLLAVLFCQGLRTEESLEQVREAVALEAALAPARDSESTPELDAQAAAALDALGKVDFEAAAARHHTLFGLNVFPHESVFLSRTADAGGEVAESVAALYATVQYAPPPDAAGPDTLTAELCFLSFLAEWEARVRTRGDDTQVAALIALQHRFLAEHLLRWLPPFVIAVEREDDRLFGFIARFLWRLAITQAGALAVEPQRWRTQPIATAARLLDAPETGLKEVARWLTTPFASGWFLSRRAIAAVGAGHDLPRGFGRRVVEMHTLLDAAFRFEEGEALVEALKNELAAWHQAYAKHATNPLAAAWLEPWQRRLDHTATLLERLGQESRPSSKHGQC